MNDVQPPQGWHDVDGALERDFRFRDFAEAIAFVDRVGGLAEGENHHSDDPLEPHDAPLC